jgi:glycerophosphoryl diester phosphodiesterase
MSSDRRWQNPVIPSFAELPGGRPEWYLNKPIIHRGLHNIFEGVVEHSRTAITRAIAAGLPIEVDIQNSADDGNFIFHDFVLHKLTNGKGEFREVKSDVIRSFSLIHTQNEPIMTLEELLELVDGRVPIMIEFKNREVVIPPGIAEAARILSLYKGQFAVQAFSPILMEWFYERYPKFTRGFITSDTDILEARDHYLLCMLRNRIKPHFLAHEMSLRNCWTFQWIFEQDLPILAWTVRDDDDWNVARTFADNIVFEFIAPDKEDWQKPSETNWRAEAGERIDRRTRRNQPPRLKHDGSKGILPWWAKNRSWPPVPDRKPHDPSLETAGFYDAPLFLLSAFENKRETYKSDPHYRAAWLDWTRVFGAAAVEQAQKSALVLLRADAILAGRGLPIVETLQRNGFVAKEVFEVRLDRNTCYELARHDWINAARERIELEVELLMLCPLVGIFLDDKAPIDGLPAAVRLWLYIDGANAGGAPAASDLAGLIKADEPLDMLRFAGILMDTPSRRACFESLRAENGPLQERPAERLRSLLDRSLRSAATDAEPCAAVRKLRELDHRRSTAQPVLPDKALPFEPLTSAVASRVWISRAR